jgi:hypothetical protein
LRPYSSPDVGPVIDLFTDSLHFPYTNLSLS